MFYGVSLEAEERCGHYVTIDVKRLWSVQLDLLDQLKVICKKHDIKYFAGGGTLLGAVRHKGYIPWDDDIDVHMFADDYDKFCKVAADELTGNYYFQLNHSMARIRNSNTTALTVGDLKKLRTDRNHNCGVFIDIFPLHNVYDNKLLRMMQKLVFHIFERLMAGHEKVSFLNSNPRKYWKFYFSKAVLLWKLFSLFCKYDDFLLLHKKMLNVCKNSNRIGLVSFMGVNDKLTWHKEWFLNLFEMPFENTTICCPKEYDLILKQQYGDYMVFKKGTSFHTMEVFDTEVSYKEKLRDLDVVG